MKVICSAVWDEEYCNRKGETVKAVRCKLGTVGSHGIWNYPYSFQLPMGSIRPELMKYYEVEFTFGYFLKNVDEVDSTGEIREVKKEVPTWRIASINVAK